MSGTFVRRAATLIFALSALSLGFTENAAAAAPAAPARPAATIRPPAPPGAKPTPASFADLVDQLSSSVVNISTTQMLRRPNTPEQDLPQLPKGSPLDDFFKDFLDPGNGNSRRRASSLGSGFVIDPAGLIVTNNHVIEDADEISVILNDGTTLPATLVGTDEKSDIALLRVKPKAALPTARFGDSDRARVGDWVVAIGQPFGLGFSVTAGIVSARSRNIGGLYDDYIQTDATINPGNSGGPLFNMNGEVVGINTAIFSRTGGSVGIGFSIPSNEAKFVINQLKSSGKVARGMIGVNIQPITDEIATSLGLPNSRGALVSGLTNGGPAAKAGIQNGDVIVAFDGKPVQDNLSLPRIVADSAIGKTVPVELIRKGQKRTVSVQVAPLKDTEAKPAAKKPAPAAPGKKLSSRLGLTLEPISADTRQRFRLGNDVRGVVVAEVDPMGPASEKGIRAGDVIVEVAQQKVATPAEVDAKVEAEAKAGRTAVLLLVNRGGQQNYIGVKLGR